VTKETFDNVTRTTHEVSAYPLTAAVRSAYLEARIDPLSLPAQMTAKSSSEAAGPSIVSTLSFPIFQTSQRTPGKEQTMQRIANIYGESRSGLAPGIRALLDSNGIDYAEIDVSDDASMLDLHAVSLAEAE